MRVKLLQVELPDYVCEVLDATMLRDQVVNVALVRLVGVLAYVTAAVHRQMPPLVYCELIGDIETAWAQVHAVMTADDPAQALRQAKAEERLARAETRGVQ